MDGKAPFKVALIGHSDPQVPAWVLAMLEASAITCACRQCDTPQQVVELAADAQVLWTFGSNPNFTASTWCEVIAAALPQLKHCGAIVRSGSGTDNVPVAAATRQGVLVVNTPAATAEPVAEYAVALMLATARQVPFDAARVRAGQWSQPIPPTARSLSGKTVGLVGFGQIAQVVARRLRGFDVTLLVSDPAVDDGEVGRLGATLVSLEALLKRSDFISLHCPLLPSTRHLIGERQFAQMKPSAIVVNTSRGQVIDEAALIRALREGVIAGAGLDVLDQEPPAADHPLLSMDQVVVTPHVAAFSEQLFDRMWRLSVESIQALSRGRCPVSCVNPEVKSALLDDVDSDAAS